jgi:hypothetical protein
MLGITVIAAVPALANDADHPRAKPWGPPKGTPWHETQKVVDQMFEHEAALEQRRGTPQERAARGQSRMRFSAASKSEALQLARSAGLDQPAFRVPGRDDGQHVVRFLDDHAVVLDGPAGRVVAISTVPLRTNDGESLNLDLQEHGAAFAPGNALSDISIAKRAGAGASVNGVTISPVGATGDEAALLGDRIFYYDTARATDYAVGVRPHGIESFFLLRGRTAPEDMALAIDGPTGAGLVGSQDPSMSAALVDPSGDPIFTLSAVSTTDADGVPVKTTTTVVGNELRIHVDHADADVKYPLTVDPYGQPYGSGAYSGSGTWAGWDRLDWNCGGVDTNYGSIGVRFFWIMASTCEGRWRYFSPGTSYVFEEDMSAVYHNSPAGDGAVWYGISNSSGGSAGGYWWSDGSATANGPQPAMERTNFTAARRLCTISNPAGNPGMCPDPGGPQSTMTFFGNYQVVAQCCYTGDQYASTPDAVLDTSDQGLPSAPTTNVPTGWVKNLPASITVSTSQSGLGIAATRLDIPDAGIYNQRVNANCNLLYTAPYRPCPNSVSQTHSLSGSLADGVHQVTTRGVTPILEGPPTTQTLKVDTTLPDVTLSGPLVDELDQLGSEDTYDLRLDPVDNLGASAYSGVAKLEVFVDNAPTPVQTWTQSCESCGMPQKTWMFDPGLNTGTHVIKIRVTDGANNYRDRTITATVSDPCTYATGASDDAEFDPSQACTVDSTPLTYDSAVGTETPSTLAPLVAFPSTQYKPIRTLLETVPDVASSGPTMPQANSTFDAKVAGLGMAQSQIVANPAATSLNGQPKFLAVYHVDPNGGTSNAGTVTAFRVELAGSNDLVTWTKIHELQSGGAVAPSLRYVASTGGWLLAYEKTTSTYGGTGVNASANSAIRLVYYANLTDLAAGTENTSRQLKRRLSRFKRKTETSYHGNEGTPDIRDVSWGGTFSNSTITLGFHYKTRVAKDGNYPFADRQAEGTLSQGNWSETALEGYRKTFLPASFKGHHGLRRQFEYGGKVWRVYDAQLRRNDSASNDATWRLILEDVAARKFTVLRVRTPANRSSGCSMPAPTDPATQPGCTTAFSSPATLALLPDPEPSRTGREIFVGSYLIPTGGGGSAPGEGGTLIFYQSPYA